MNLNPFLTPAFVSSWRQHFTPSRALHDFKVLPGIKFVRHQKLPCFYNAGATHTKGITFTLSTSDEVPQEVLLLYDIPSYHMPEPLEKRDGMGHLTSLQYPGYLIDLDGFNSLAAYMQSLMSKSSRYKLNKYRKRLEYAFDISYHMYGADINKEQYAILFSQFRRLLVKRFADKAMYNNNLDQTEWAFYKDSTYQLLQEGLAKLFVVYNDQEPISFALTYVHGETLIDAITVFDIDYAKFHLGSVIIMYLIEWCIAHHFQKLDLSKGYFEYKERWCNKKYDFHYHIFFPANSISKRLLAHGLKKAFDLKNSLRKRKFNERWNKRIYQKNWGRKPVQEVPLKRTYTYSEVAPLEELPAYRPLEQATPKTQQLRPVLFEFLYLNNDKEKETELWQHNDSPDTYLIRGKSNTWKIQFHT